MTTLEAVAAQTAPIYLYLKNDGATPTNPDGTALTMSGMTMVLIVTDLDGNSRTIAGAMSIETSASWLVKYAPDAADLAVGTWRYRVKVTDSGGKIGYFPSATWDQLIVRSA